MTISISSIGPYMLQCVAVEFTFIFLYNEISHFSGNCIIVFMWYLSLLAPVNKIYSKILPLAFYLKPGWDHNFGGKIQGLFKDFQLPFPDLFQQRFSVLEGVYGFI